MKEAKPNNKIIRGKCLKHVMQVCFIVILDISGISLQQMESFMDLLQKAESIWKKLNQNFYLLFF